MVANILLTLLSLQSHFLCFRFKYSYSGGTYISIKSIVIATDNSFFIL